MPMPFCAGHRCDCGYLSGGDGGCVAEIFVGGVEDACESGDVGVEDAACDGVVECGVLEACSGGEDEYVHAVDKLDEVVEAFHGVGGGDVYLGCGHAVGIKVFDGLEGLCAACGDAYAASYAGEIGGQLIAESGGCADDYDFLHWCVCFSVGTAGAGEVFSGMVYITEKPTERELPRLPNPGM